MKKQFSIFGALLLSLAAGMTVSELVSYSYERAGVAETRMQAQSPVSAVAADVPLGSRVVN
jgi:hypothetical protein